jgi:hypothetical protein
MERDSVQCSQTLESQVFMKIDKKSGTKSGTAYENPQNDQLSDVVSAWSSLPPNIRAAIVLLVQQHVQ